MALIDEALKPLEFEISNLKEAANVASHRTANAFLFAFCVQYAITQYGTYVAFSWDILEPFCCTMTLTDSVIAYMFWIWSGQPYDMDGLKRFYFDRSLKKMAKKNSFDIHYYNQLKERKGDIMNKLKNNA